MFKQSFIAILFFTCELALSDTLIIQSTTSTRDLVYIITYYHFIRTSIKLKLKLLLSGLDKQL